MTTVKRIAPASAFKIGLVAYGLLGLFLGFLCSMLSLVGADTMGLSMPLRHIGVLAIVICPIVYGLVGGIGAAIAAFIYNLVAGWIGGLEIELSGSPTPEPTPEPQLVH